MTKKGMITRVQLDFSKTEVMQLDKVKRAIGATSRAETVRRALNLMDLATKGLLRMKIGEGEDKKDLVVWLV